VLDSGKGANEVTASALKLRLYTDLRDGAPRAAEWKEIDFDAARWTMPAERMKRRVKEERQEHAVPLSKQTLAVLRDVQDYTGHGPESSCSRARVRADSSRRTRCCGRRRDPCGWVGTNLERLGSRQMYEAGSMHPLACRGGTGGFAGAYRPPPRSADRSGKLVRGCRRMRARASRVYGSRLW
jgi:integrase